MDKNCFVSWSGGKDSCLALFRAMSQGYKPKMLFTMFSIENDVSSAHRLNEDIIKAQVNELELESTIGRAKFEDYEAVFVRNLESFKSQDIQYGIFGDIDLDEHRKWEETVCEKAQMTAVLPLWQEDRKKLVKEFIDLGFKARIVVVNKTMMSPEFLGRDLSHELLEEIEKTGADVCGENGEYHTVVYDGPLFKTPLNLNFSKEVKDIEGKWAKIEVLI
ncbi:diphthine--ammonia ligase [Acetoanaerobium noterae]|uniref:Dph6-related ATP pyrophosphatase n=1 Tax=Acetoanaerobium noterae TaxID=745369 RepID=UPI0028AA6FA3|nr:diphthine--ammonia ligase [Acetoanaerobium noterae]